MCASKSITFWRSSRSNPVITEITRISTVTPSITPNTEINVMMERNVRFGFKYRSARKTLKGSFKSAVPRLRTQDFANDENITGSRQAQMGTNETQMGSGGEPESTCVTSAKRTQHRARYRPHAVAGVQCGERQGRHDIDFHRKNLPLGNRCLRRKSERSLNGEKRRER